MPDLVAMENAYFSAEPEKDWDQRCEGIAKAGFDGIYLVPYPLEQTALDGHMRRLSEVEGRHGIKPSAIYANIDLANPRSEDSTNGPLNIIEAVDTIPRLELSIKCSDPTQLPINLEDEIAIRLEPLLKLADSKEIDIALYHHSFYPVETPGDVQRILERLPHPRLKMLFATSHAYAIWDKETVARQLENYAPSISSFNICGCRREDPPPSKVSHSPPHDSELPLHELLSILDASDYDGDIIVQGGGWAGNISEELKRTANWFGDEYLLKP